MKENSALKTWQSWVRVTAPLLYIIQTDNLNKLLRFEFNLFLGEEALAHLHLMSNCPKYIQRLT